MSTNIEPQELEQVLEPDSLTGQLDQECFKRRQIFLWGDIEEYNSKKICQQIMFLSMDKQPFTLNIHSNGGDVEAMFSIIDLMDLAKQYTTVSTICLGKACSCAAIILANGSPKHRQASKCSSIMFHPISYELPFDYASKQKSNSDFIKKQSELYNKIMCKILGKKEKDWEKLIEDGLWLTSKDALKLKVIDEII